MVVNENAGIQDEPGALEIIASKPQAGARSYNGVGAQDVAYTHQAYGSWPDQPSPQKRIYPHTRDPNP